jgi:glycosyltransferase involved in cell wall biosynthesis
MRKLVYFISFLIYAFAQSIYRFFNFILKPLIYAHPRIQRFDTVLKDAVKELLKPPTMIPENTSQPSIETVPKSIHKSGYDNEKKVNLPDWLIQEWREIHSVEPQLFPEKWLIENISFYHIPTSRLSDPYIELCNLYGKDISHVFLVPWLVKGGADLVTINYIQALKGNNLAKGITVISTLNADSPWAVRLPENVRFIEFGKIYSYLSQDEQEKLLSRLLLQMAPKVIHNINSELGYKIFVQYGKALSTFSNLYVSSFCIDLIPEDQMSGYPVWYLPKCFNYLQALFSENQTHLNRLNEMYAFEQQKMFVHYQPIDIPKKQNIINKDIKKEHLDILWAGRLDRQKRPDILIRIAEKCLNLAFKFHVYGSPVLDIDIYTRQFAKLNNVTYHGPFNGLASLPADRYDVFLYTSQWDGIPNILLEAILLNLPVIASNVGGVAEVITNEKTGFLIDPYDDIEKYVNCLSRINNDRSLIYTLTNNAYALVNKRHSWDIFIENLKRVRGYISSNELNLLAARKGEPEFKKK